MRVFCSTVGAAFISVVPVGALVDPYGKDALRQLLIPLGSVSCAFGLIAAASTKRTITKRQTYGPDGERMSAAIPVVQLKQMQLWQEEVVDLRDLAPMGSREQFPLSLEEVS